MKIRNYMASLLPSFGRDRVLEDCGATRTEIKEVTQPAYEQAMHFFRTWKFKSKVLEAQFGTFERLVGGSGNPLVRINKAWPNILHNIEAVEELAKKTLNEEVAGAGLTYLKANLLQFAEASAFVSKYARKFLNYVYICETAEFGDGGTTIKDSLTPAEIDWIQSNLLSFCQAFNVVSGNPVNVRKQIADIPDIQVTPENVDTLPQTMGLQRVDPFKMGLIPIVLNPIYHIGMAVAEWQASRYKAAQEEKRLVELRKLNLEKVAAGKPDAKVQQEIDYLASRVQTLNYKIAQMERDHGLAH